MPEERDQLPQESFLIVDCGSSTTTAVLFDIVEGSYRMIARAVAPTTSQAPWNDIAHGVQHAIAQISETTGRRLLTSEGALITPEREAGEGVDHFGVAISAAGPLRAIVGGLMDDVSLVSIRRALRTIYARELDVFSLSDSRSQQAQVDAIWRQRPEVILLAGGTDGGAGQRVMKLVETIDIGLNLLNGYRKPEVLFAGNSSLRARINEQLGDLANLHTAANVRPSLETEQLDDAGRILGDLYEGLKIAALPGIDELAGWCSLPLVPTARAFATVIEYLAAIYQGHVLGLDLGSDSVTVVSGEADSVRLAVYSDMGMGRPLANLLARVEPTTLLQWLPLELNVAGLNNFIQHKILHPRSLPLSDEDLLIEQCLARHILQWATMDAGADWGWSPRGQSQIPPFKLLILRGQTLTNTPRPGHAILMALDALQPVGAFAVAIDRYGVLPALGVLAPHQSLVTVQALEAGLLVDLGWVIVPVGRARAGDKVMDITMISEETGRLEVDVHYGELEVLPLATGQTARLHLRPTRHFDVGFGPGREQKVTVHGGAVGLVIDARGRPLILPRDDSARRTLLRQWFWDVGG
jgi:hypothetical protein